LLALIFGKQLGKVLVIDLAIIIHGCRHHFLDLRLRKATANKSDFLN
jgi:hypothetical protein